jgi:hypothetical protein
MTDETEHDDLLSLELLTGLIKSGETIATRYPKHNSEREKKCRAALARIIRNGMKDWFVAEFLALAIDPDTSSKITGLKPPRHIRFQSPSRGLPSTAMRDLWVAILIHNLTRQGEKKDYALKRAEEAYGIDHSTAVAAHRKYRAQLERQPNGSKRQSKLH